MQKKRKPITPSNQWSAAVTDAIDEQRTTGAAALARVGSGGVSLHAVPEGGAEPRETPTGGIPEAAAS
jgi:hypothetical protein